MRSLNPHTSTKAHLTLASTIAKHSDLTKTRIRLHIPPDYQQDPIISRLISDHGLSVNITGATLATTQAGIFDLELRGTPQQIQAGLMYLRSLNIQVIGKPNPEGDSWHY
jgi:ABC-type methionine transport system ATPase subunit